MSGKQIWLRILGFTGRYKRLAIFSVVCALVTVAASLIGPFFIGKTVDQMVGPGNVDFAEIGRLLLILGLIYGIGSLFGWFLYTFTNKIAYQTVFDMRRALFAKINDLPLSFHDTHPHGDSISRFVNDMDAVSDGLLQGFSTLLTGIFTIAGAIGLMLYISPMITLVVLLSAPVSFYVARFITLRTQQMFREQAKVLGTLNGYVEEMIGGQKTVKAFGYEKRAYAGFEERNATLQQAGIKAQFYGSLSNPSTRLVNNITFSVIALIGSLVVIRDGITVGELSSFLIYANLFAKPFNEITGVITQLQGATASAQRIFTLMDLTPEIPDVVESGTAGHADTAAVASSATSSAAQAGVIRFEHVRFAYTPERPLITDFSLTVQPGTRIAIVGQTGAGKTTLVNLLMRFYEVGGGTITIGGTDIRAMSRDRLRQSFGMVLQDTWLFAGTVRDNIAYGKPDATDEEVIAAAKAAHAHSFIKRLPQGYQTPITGTGGSLSQGQEQLLTIARVMLADPPMLILDEATSSIDTRTEIRIQKAFQKMTAGRTSFVIAHRLSTIREADLILFMANGDVVESGTHEELLASGGYYARLYNSQFAAV